MKRFHIFGRLSIKALAPVLLIALAGASAVRAEEQNGGLPGDWLSHYASARSMGIGGAFVAAADEPLGAVWNPAGLSAMWQNALHFETIRLFEDTAINGFSLGMPASKYPSFGFTVLALSSGDFERTNDLNEPEGTFNVGEMAFLFSAAKNLTPEFAVGANVKLAHQSIIDFSGTGTGIDFGAMYNVTPALRIGASLLNVGGPRLTMRTTGEKYPAEFRTGVAYYLFGDRGLIAAEVDHRSGFGATLHGGSEFWVHRTLALRFGFDDVQPAGGLSARIGEALRLDYGVSDHELGVTHRIGIAYQFGGFFASSEANPSIFSPIGEQSVTRFNLKAKAKYDIRTWRLEITDKSDQVVRSFSGSGAPPSHVMWDGKSEVGFSLPDGVYSFWLIVEDEEGHEVVGPVRHVEITTAGPQGAVPVVVQ